MGTKKIKAVLLGSPFVFLQIALFIYMAIFGIRAIFQVIDAPFLQWCYTLSILYTLVLALVSLIRVFITEPGKVTPALIEQLKN